MDPNEIHQAALLRNQTNTEIAKTVQQILSGNETKLFDFLRQSWLQFCDVWEQKGTPLPSDAVLDFALRITLNCDLKHAQQPQPDDAIFRAIIDKTMALFCRMPNGVRLMNEVLAKINTFYHRPKGKK